MPENLQEKAEQIAESYINGNITWAREQLKSHHLLAMMVYAILQDNYNDDSATMFFNRMVA